MKETLRERLERTVKFLEGSHSELGRSIITYRDDNNFDGAARAQIRMGELGLVLSILKSVLTN